MVAKKELIDDNNDKIYEKHGVPITNYNERNLCTLNSKNFCLKIEIKFIIIN